jgi:hypothetical protein
MSYSDQYTSSPFDQDLAESLGLTWVPWVGKNYANLPESRKVLIVAESHYTNEQDAEKMTLTVEQIMGDKSYTRAVVSESLINAEWTTRTLSTMHQLFYSPNDRDAFWNDVAYFNLIQRPMWYRDGNPERPAWQDFWAGWEAFLKVVEILKPDHILFIGVEAANHFNGFMAHHGRDHLSIQWAEKVGSAYARTASLSVDEKQIPLHFIKHCGSYFSTDRWSDYLHRNARDLMASLAFSAGVEISSSPTQSLHVLGIAKSSLNLRGAKEQKLELDFLRLAYAVRELREAGEEAIGYLLVLVPDVARTAERWCEKYTTGEGVVILCEPIEGETLEALLKEKADNALGLLQALDFDQVSRALSLANIGKELGERALHKFIDHRHVGISPLQDNIPREQLPLQVKWDFYGTIDLGN